MILAGGRLEPMTLGMSVRPADSHKDKDKVRENGKGALEKKTSIRQ
jgi:hypothetical protein